MSQGARKVRVVKQAEKPGKVKALEPLKVELLTNSGGGKTELEKAAVRQRRKLERASSPKKRVRPKNVKRRKSKATWAGDTTEPDRCTAKSKSTGKRCQKTKAPGKQQCLHHGGHPLAGRPSKHGLYSLGNTSLAPIFAALEGRIEEMRDLDETLRLAHAILQRNLNRYGELDTPGFRAAALQLFDEAREATDPKGMQEKMRALRALLARGVSEDAAVKTMEGSLERVQRFQMDLAKVIYTQQTVVTADQLATFFVRWLEVTAQLCGGKQADEVSRVFGAEIAGQG